MTTVCRYDDEDESMHRRQKKKGYFANIKWGTVGLLVMLTGGTVLPAVIWIFDHLSLPAVPGMGAFMLWAGMGATPKVRMEKFYKKHNPEKVTIRAEVSSGSLSLCGARLGMSILFSKSTTAITPP